MPTYRFRAHMHIYIERLNSPRDRPYSRLDPKAPRRQFSQELPYLTLCLWKLLLKTSCTIHLSRTSSTQHVISRRWNDPLRHWLRPWHPRSRPRLRVRTVRPIASTNALQRRRHLAFPPSSALAMSMISSAIVCAAERYPSSTTPP